MERVLYVLQNLELTEPMQMIRAPFWRLLVAAATTTTVSVCSARPSPIPGRTFLIQLVSPWLHSDSTGTVKLVLHFSRTPTIMRRSYQTIQIIYQKTLLLLAGRPGYQP